MGALGIDPCGVAPVPGCDGLVDESAISLDVVVTWHLIMRITYKQFQMLRLALKLRISS